MATGPRVVVGLALALLVSCGHPAPPPAPPMRPATPVTPPPDAAPEKPTKIGVALTVTPADAEVLIDGTSYGKASDLDAVVELKPGLYTLVVAHPGFVSYRVEFSVGEKTESFVVRLEPLKP